MPQPLFTAGWGKPSITAGILQVGPQYVGKKGGA